MKNLQEYRKDAGLSQAQLTKKAGTGPNSVPIAEACKRMPIKSQVEKWACALGLKTADLYTGHYLYCMRKDLTIFDVKGNEEFKQVLDYLLERAKDVKASGDLRIACIEAARTVLKEYFG